ncbi:uncharacterized protein LOC131220978 [Magnolia sinica]|uniref:uncharacterized protein LOC131220978 n=1 Tax=Magnolia sinica TaxID=86752 RepID=UPI00265A860E|nr:uncharacterized protein LOC131220978 [Magnolia sinica]XP_058072003.1 uncharacterized protein LOC131220978 [Magnolia sinica]
MAYSSTDMDHPFFETSPSSPDRNPAKEVMAYPSSTSETSPVCTTKKCRKLKQRRLEGSLEQDEQLLLEGFVMDISVRPTQPHHSFIADVPRSTRREERGIGNYHMRRRDEDSVDLFM